MEEHRSFLQASTIVILLGAIVIINWDLLQSCFLFKAYILDSWFDYMQCKFYLKRDILKIFNQVMMTTFHFY